jgi:hypothetical protein
MTADDYTTRDQIVSEVEMKWCERMTYLVENCRIFDADALYSEYVVDEKDPEEWIFVPFHDQIK